MSTALGKLQGRCQATVPECEQHLSEKTRIGFLSTARYECGLAGDKDHIQIRNGVIFTCFALLGRPALDCLGGASFPSSGAAMNHFRCVANEFVLNPTSGPGENAWAA